MVRYSHVSLSMFCKMRPDADVITSHLSVKPSDVRESKSKVWTKEEGWRETISYRWILDSPTTDAEPEVRLKALADIIESFADRLRTLDPRFRPMVDVLYHVTPQHSHGVTGEFEWLRLSPEIMRRFGNWNLPLSYETMWFDHPDWVKRRRGFWPRLRNAFRRNSKK